MPPACAFARLARLTNKHGEYVHRMPKTVGNTESVATNDIPECHQHLNHQRCTIRFGVRLDPANDVASQALKRKCVKWFREVVNNRILTGHYRRRLDQFRDGLSGRLRG